MDKRYVLRKPIEAHYVSDSNEWYIEILGYLNNGEFDEMFVEFSFDATRKQIDNALEDYANFKLWESRQDWKDDFDRKGNLANEKQMHVDKLLALLGGTTNGK